MVRVYDPTKTDPSLIFIEYFKNFFFQPQSLSIDLATNSILKMIKTNNYEKIKMEKYPILNFKRNCIIPPFIFRKKFDKNFPGYYNPDKDEINLCLNYMNNLFELKENFDREMKLRYELKNSNIMEQTKSKLNEDESFACSIIRACKYQHRSLNSGEKIEEELSKLCAKHILVERGPNSQKLPFDKWNRKSRKLINEYFYCYYN